MARINQGLVSTDRLRACNTALSTASLLRPHSGKEVMGEVLAERGHNTLPAAMRRDFLQMMGNAFPVFKIVARNSWGAVSASCQLCQQDKESYAHVQMWC